MLASTDEVSVRACVGCLAVFCACVCILPSVCVQLDSVWRRPQPSLQLWMGFICILKRSSTCHCCFAAVTRHLELLAAVPVASGCGCDGELVANHHLELRLWSVGWKKVCLMSFSFVSYPVSPRVCFPLTNRASPFPFLSASPSHSRCKPGDTLGSFCCHQSPGTA